MTQLLRTQAAFLACLLDDEAPLPSGWDERRAAGIDVYRNAYRSRLIDVMRSIFERTSRLVGDDAFIQAAAHHLITNPPTRWTIDLVGKGFSEVCAELFTNDPDVEEVAWLEWAMHEIFTAADDAPLTLADFASATTNFDDAQWENLRFEFISGMTLRPVEFDLRKLWETLAESTSSAEIVQLTEPKWLIAWREKEQPVFALFHEREGLSVDKMRRGATFGDVCNDLSVDAGAQLAAATVGGMLRNWLDIGLVKGLHSYP
ncbi:DNA-binding domain-containing protein [Erythrobacter colymbi]|uniref:HvfC/BufC N-terminal domain-containing protein n=1 Tax=Erythrobacter colymbi TaxID=1161202 RepID=UPI000A37892B|nr:DNA-binding domain-containing protein [Erythrobacter colymbi]